MSKAIGLPDGISLEFREIYNKVKDLSFGRGKYAGQIVFGVAWVHGEEPYLMLHRQQSPWNTHVKFSEVDPALISTT